MTTITVRRQAMVNVAMLALFWAGAAAMVVLTDQIVGSGSPVVSTILKVMAIVVAAFVYMRLAAQEATLDHALFGGVVWLFLAIAGEIAMTMLFHRGWYLLLGSPASALRNVVMFAWVIAPALFARNAR
jgi:hypothetical protein